MKEKGVQNQPISTVAAVYERVNELRWRGLFPSLHHRKEGWLRHQENIAKSPKLTQPGWFSSLFSFGKPPRPRYQRMLRGIFLLARPPLLAVMQGGEYSRFQYILYDRRYSRKRILIGLASFC